MWRRSNDFTERKRARIRALFVYVRTSMRTRVNGANRADCNMTRRRPDLISGSGARGSGPSSFATDWSLTETDWSPTETDWSPTETGRSSTATGW